MQRSALLISVIALLLSGCSGLRPYVSNGQKNVTISTVADTKGFLASVEPSLDIYRMESDCDLDYQGTVDLRNSSVAIELPTGQPAYLVFNFTSSAFFSYSSGVMSYDTVLNPESGYVYDVDVSYRDSLYEVQIFERRSGATQRDKLSTTLIQSDCSN